MSRPLEPHHARGLWFPSGRSGTPARHSRGKLGPLVFLLLVTLGCVAERPAAGRMEMSLQPCPDSPNCVSSLDARPGHHVEPLRMRGTAADTLAALRELVESMPRARVTQVDEHALHSEFRSRIFRFVDDVDFRIDEAAGLVHVRSASRLGYSDLGVNRKRVEEIRRRWERQ